MVRVTAAILRRGDQILIARRAPGQNLAGFWEFPGGKIEAGETPEACLARELSEELSLEVEVGVFVTRNLHEYPGGSIELIAYEVRAISGDLELRVHDRIAWAVPRALLDYQLAPADVEIAEFLAAL